MFKDVLAKFGETGSTDSEEIFSTINYFVTRFSKALEAQLGPDAVEKPKKRDVSVPVTSSNSPAAAKDREPMDWAKSSIVCDFNMPDEQVQFCNWSISQIIFFIFFLPPPALHSVVKTQRQIPRN